jgi:hypothetical protein
VNNPAVPGGSLAEFAGASASSLCICDSQMILKRRHACGEGGCQSLLPAVHFEAGEEAELSQANAVKRESKSHGPLPVWDLGRHQPLIKRSLTRTSKLVLHEFAPSQCGCLHVPNLKAYSEGSV